MRTTSISLIPLLLILTSLFSHAAQRARPTNSPDSVVRELYRVHKNGKGGVFEAKGKKYIYKFFDQKLANLIWKDARTSKGEVGVIDGDPLYDAQDMEIKKFAIAKPRNEDGRALVDATFENFGQKKTITFIVVKGPTGWRIRDIVYGEGRTLTSEFKEAR